MDSRGFVERILDRLFDYQEIKAGCEADNDPLRPVYLKRWYIVKRDDPDRSAGVFRGPGRSRTIHLGGNGVQLYLHKIMRSDADRELHDHPWAFASLILWRGYHEETEAIGGLLRPLVLGDTTMRRKLPGMILFRAAEHRHRVHVGSRPAWSLVFTSSKRKSWGFFRAGQFIPWRLFISRKCDGNNMDATASNVGMASKGGNS